MERVLIIGSNGAGKSTFSFRLAEKTGLPLVHIDQLYWRGAWDVTPDLRWIIEGNNLRSLPRRLVRADTVFWFEFPPPLCVLNIFRREWAYRGRVRPDMPDQCVSRWDMKFLQMVWDFNRRNHRKIAAMLSNAENIRVIRFTNYRQVEGYLRTL